MTAFDKAFAIVVGEEGGFTADGQDRGNWTSGVCGVGQCKGTKFGISAASYPTLDIANLALDRAKAIYRSDYWTPIHGDDLPPGLALLVFDAAVNNGVGQAKLWLQAAVGVRSDGQIGPQTMAAVAKARMPDVGVEFQSSRLLAMAAMSSWSTYGKGWARRLCRLPYLVGTMG